MHLGQCIAWLLLPIAFASGLEWNPKSQDIPDYVKRHAPFVYLYSEEVFRPGNIADYIREFKMGTESANYTEDLTLDILRSSGEAARHEESSPEETLYLTAKHQWQGNPPPDWLQGVSPRLWDGSVDAPAVVIVVEKPELGVVDAFWFYFYPFNLGPFVMGHGPFGNHLGDWEHSLVRFNITTGQPMVVWMSAHGGGTAYEYTTMENKRGHPLIFAARGTHAQYPSTGAHSHDIPWHMLGDFTDRGALWDPTQNFMAYTFDGKTVHPSNGSHPDRENQNGDWLLFDGCWGNKQLDNDDPRQQWSPWQWRIIDGPKGPLFKNLMRTVPCERSKWWNVMHSCRIRHRVTAGEGMDSDISGCQAYIELFPPFLRPVLEFVTQGGYFCFWLDRLWG